MMHRYLLTLAILGLVSSAALGQVSGKVAVVEKGGLERKVLQGVLVYVDGIEAPIPAELRQRHVVISSREKTFEPHVEAVPAGSSVTFPNFDDIMHNVFSISKGNRFDLGLYKSGARKDFVFENPGLVRIYCNIHPHMSAFIHVLPNPFFTWAAPDGSFHIDSVPAGSYSLNVWHEEGDISQPIVVTEQGASGLRLTLDVSKYKKRTHLNKFGKPYKRKRGKY